MKKKEIDNYMKQLANQIYEIEYAEYMNGIEEYHVFQQDFLETKKLHPIESIKMNKQKISYSVVIACTCLFLICGIAFGALYLKPNRAIAGEINWNLEKISELDLQTSMSSNPYAYKDTENYNNIVNMGPIAIEVLVEKYKNGELGGFTAYLAGASIEDIAHIQMIRVSGQDWSTAEEFFALWEDTILHLPQTFKEITESEDSMQMKIERIQTYGIYGKFFLQYIQQQEKENISFLGYKIDVRSIRGHCGDIDKLSDKDYSIIKKYLENLFRKTVE